MSIVRLTKRLLQLLLAICLLLIALISLIYWNATTLLDTFAPRYLSTLGIRSTFQFQQVTTQALHLSSASLATDEWQVNVTGVQISYSLDSLRAYRVDTTTIDTLDVNLSLAQNRDTQNTSGAAASTAELPSPWAMLPTSVLVIHHLNLNNSDPSASINGSITINKDEAGAQFTLASPLLPTVLDASVSITPAGDFNISLGQPDDQPALNLTGGPDDSGHILFSGNLLLEDETFELVSGIAGITNLRGKVNGDILGRIAWPASPESLLPSLALGGTLDLAIAIDVPGVTGGKISGPVVFNISNEAIALSSAGISVGSQIAGNPWRLQGLDYLLSPKSKLQLEFSTSPMNIYGSDFELASASIRIKPSLSFQGDPIILSPDAILSGLRIDGEVGFNVQPAEISIDITNLKIDASGVTVEQAPYRLIKGDKSAIRLAGLFKLPGIATLRHPRNYSRHPLAASKVSGTLHLNPSVKPTTPDVSRSISLRS